MVSRFPSILLLAILAVYLPSSLAAVGSPGATVSGHVFAADTGAPLARAYVFIDGTSLGALADAEGRYAIAGIPAGSRRLIASHIGYRPESRTLELAPGEELSLDFSLSVVPLPMDAVLVTARGRSSRLADLAGSAGVVDAFDLGRANPVSLPEATATLAGVSIASDMPWASQVQIRGLSRDHVVFLVDGNRVSTTTEVAAQFGTVAMADLEQVEVLKGPISVLYGTGSTGGVINAIPRRGRFNAIPRWTLATNLAYESIARGFSGYTRVGLDAPNLYLMFSQAYRDYDSYSDGSGERIANSQFRDYQSHLNLGCRLTSSQSLDLRYQWFEARDVGIPGGGSVFPVGATVTYPRTRRWLAEATWRYAPPLAVWHRAELKFFLQNLDRRAEVLPVQVTYLPPGDGQPLRRSRPRLIAPSADHDATGARWHNELILAGHELAWGIEAWQKRLTSTRLRVTEVDFLQPDSSVIKTVESRREDRSLPNSLYRPIGLYAEDEFHPSSRLTLDLGARIDLIHVDSETTYRSYLPPTEEVLWPASRDDDLSWSAQARTTYAFAPSWKAYATLARSFRSPGLEERFLYVDLGNLVKIGDPGLDSENGFFLETGISAQTSRLQWNSQLFYNRIEGLVIDRPATFEGRPALQKANAGIALFVGGEGELTAELGHGLLIAASLAYVRGTDEKKDENLPAIAPLNGLLALQSGEYQRGWWSRAEWRFAARQDRVAPGESPTAGHRVLNLSAGFSGLRIGDLCHWLTVGVKNALDARYRDHLTTSRGFELTAPGRSFYATWSMER